MVRFALSIMLPPGRRSAFGFVFGRTGGRFSACCCTGFGGGSDFSCSCEPARACSVVSPRDALGCASGLAPSLSTSSGPITTGGIGGGCCCGGGGGGGGCT